MKNKEIIIAAAVAFYFGFYLGYRNSVPKDSTGRSDQPLINRIDSLSSENSRLQIDLGRYEIIMERLAEKYPKVEEEVTSNLE